MSTSEIFNKDQSLYQQHQLIYTSAHRIMNPLQNMEIVSYLLAELKQHKDAVDAGARILLAVFGSFGMFFLYMRTQALQKSASAAERQAETAVASQVNDQYIKSIDQLGSPQTSVRLGAIYSLEKIALSSEEFYRQVIEVLTAYIREHAVKVAPAEHENFQPKLDVQAILTVLGRAKNNGKVSFNLTGAYFLGYHLHGDFSEAFFREASFVGAKCANANFRNADFIKAILEDTICTEADFSGANCRQAKFISASLAGANFNSANCTEVEFSASNFFITNFSQANCTKANFSNVSLYESNFSDADCRNARFNNAILWHTVFDRALCIGTDFSGADCENSSFSNAKYKQAIGLTLVQEKDSAIANDDQ